MVLYVVDYLPLLLLELQAAVGSCYRRAKSAILMGLLYIFYSVIVKTVVIDPVRGGLPLKVIQCVYWLYFDPPTPPLHRFADQLRVIARRYSKLVAVINVCIIKRYFALLLLFLVSILLLVPSLFFYCQLG